MGQIHNIEKLTDCKFLNLYHLNATSIHNTPVSYFVASRAKSINELKIKTGKKFHIADERIMREAEHKLHGEFAYVLNIKLDEVVPFIMGELQQAGNIN